MKVVQINVTLNSGSTGRIVYQLHEYMKGKGIENSIAFGYGDKKDVAGFSLYSAMGVHMHSFLSRVLCMQGLCSVWQTVRLIGYLKREKPDLIHLHNLHGHYLNYPILFHYLRKWDKPVVWTLHDCWAFTGKCAHYFSATCDKWTSECHHCPNLGTYPDSSWDGSRRNYRLKKRLFSSLGKLTLVCNSDWLKGQVSKSFLQNMKTCRIYNGVDTEVFCRSEVPATQTKEKYGIPADKFMILGVSGVWKEAKGLGTFYRLAEHLDEGYVVVLVGVAPQQKEKLPANIIGITKTEDARALAALYSAADVLFNPSREETFGMVAAEAMACGTPVIVSNTTACPEPVKGHTGVTVNTQEIPEVLRAIEQIKKEGKDAYSESCVQNIKMSFSREIMCAEYLKLYQELTKRDKI
ncbi:MAG: glycosyltransferase [Oscillospiraceae bacterium]|nr:glycosyltransferase [Oscillospiraceae bacterium]